MNGKTGKPPWWRWYEPPRWFPDWLHLITCTHCRGGRAWARQQEREMRAEVPAGGAR